MPMNTKTYDAIVVGSGITGGWAAKELTERGLRVLLLERGRQVTHGKDYVGEHQAPWDMPFRGEGDRQRYARDFPVQSQCYAMNEYTESFFVNDRQHPYESDPSNPFLWIRGYQLGGRSLTWGRQVYRWSDLDFAANVEDGYGVDWPIRYKDLAPWYDRVEQFIGVSGAREDLPHLPDGEFLPPMKLNCVERHFKQALEKQYPERRLTIGRTAILTEAHNGRSPCHYCGPCERGCSAGAYFSSLSATLPAAEVTGKLTVQTDAIVEQVEFDKTRGRASGVTFIESISGQRRTVEAKVIFLCASTLASTQILLNSRSEVFPNGLGNSSGTLGHYLMDHVMTAPAFAHMPGFEDQAYYGNRPNGFFIPRFGNVGKQNRDYVRGYGCQGYAVRMGWERGLQGAGIGLDFKRSLRRPGPWMIGFSGFGECLPNYNNRVSLNLDKRDQWGIPQLKVEFRFGANEEKLAADFRRESVSMLEAAGAKNIVASDEVAPGGLAVHEMGTARMGRDHRTSVLNGNNQCHDVPNLFVTDGACMTSSAWQNPSLTYMALTARAANFAADAIEKGVL